MYVYMIAKERRLLRRSDVGEQGTFFARAHYGGFAENNLHAYINAI